MEPGKRLQGGQRSEQHQPADVRGQHEHIFICFSRQNVHYSIGGIYRNDIQVP